MRWLHRAERVPPLPARAREGLALARGERSLAHAQTVDGGWVVATTSALLLVGPVDGTPGEPATPPRRVPWHEVAEAGWDPETTTIDVLWAAPSEPALRLRLDRRGSYFPEVLRERVMSTYLLSQRVAVSGRRGVTVAIRRNAVDGSLFSQVVPDDGVDLARPQVAEQVAALARDLAQQVGLPA